MVPEFLPLCLQGRLPGSPGLRWVRAGSCGVMAGAGCGSQGGGDWRGGLLAPQRTGVGGALAPGPPSQVEWPGHCSEAGT